MSLARREHGARNWRARLAGGTVNSRRTRPGPGGYGAVAAAGAQADPRADPRKELKEAGAPVAAGVGAVKEDGHGDSSVVRVVGAGHRQELLHVWLLGARACGPLACLTVVGGGGDRDCSMTRVAFLALPTQLLRARRRRRHLEPATPRLASLRVGGSDRDCSAPERQRRWPGRQQRGQSGFSGFACPAAPCQEEEETPRTCDTMARLAAGSTHVTDEETKEHSYLLTRTRFEAELRPVEQKLSALRSLLAQRPFFEVPSPLGAVDLYEYACGDEDLEPL
nr:uncharacterized protein LOC117978515 [Pan paniscus]